MLLGPQASLLLCSRTPLCHVSLVVVLCPGTPFFSAFVSSLPSMRSHKGVVSLNLFRVLKWSHV